LIILISGIKLNKKDFFSRSTSGEVGTRVLGERFHLRRGWN